MISPPEYFTDKQEYSLYAVASPLRVQGDASNDVAHLSGLFHPQQDRWDEHFERNGVLIAGRSAVGRAAVVAEPGGTLVFEDRARCHCPCVFTSVTDLRRNLMRYIKQYDKTAKPVRLAYADPTRRIA
jgi:hypothetical protein